MSKCPLCHDTGVITVIDYPVRTYKDTCPACGDTAIQTRYQVWQKHRLYSKGRSLLIDLLQLQGILNKEV